MVELAVVLVIAAILVTAAVPGMRQFARQQARSGLLNDLNGSLRFARASAIERRQPTVLCALDANNACASAATTNFADGWVVFLDSDGDGIKDGDGVDGDGNVVPSDEPILRDGGADAESGASLRLKVEASVAGTNRRVVSFDRFGRLRVAPGAPDPQTHFVYCDSTGNSGAQTLYVTLAGLPMLSGDANGDGKDDFSKNSFDCP